MKNAYMQKTAGTLLALMLVFGATQILVSGQDKERSLPDPESGFSSRTLEGVWQTTVTQRNCQNGDVIRTSKGLSVYHKGGTMSETSAALPPALRTPGYGVWEKRRHSNYSSSFIFLRFNPDGSYAGTQKIISDIELGPNGNTYTTTTSVQIFDASDSLIGTGCATATATRFG
jgi:hypothetical protein